MLNSKLNSTCDNFFERNLTGFLFDVEMMVRLDGTLDLATHFLLDVIDVDLSQTLAGVFTALTSTLHDITGALDSILPLKASFLI